ncbi:MAG: hypothetical protein ACRENE_29035 [Polyangiaceae bacterium]
MALSRLPLVLSVGVACFAAGFVSSHLFERSAGAASATVTPGVYVPPEGLVFRTYDGHIVARLGYDFRGGHFDVYDRNERPVAQLKADGNVDPGLARPLNPLDMRIK